uniref:Uncharacterized protein n=1 Tax=Meloidogyne incognita TaxID=6306 RepID=A0A914L1M2_MELIC
MALNNHPSNFTSEQTSKKTGKPEQLKSSRREISSLMKEKQPQQLVPTTIQPPILRRNSPILRRIHWRCNDKTVIRPDGNRYEYYGLELEEIYLASVEAYRSSASKKCLLPKICFQSRPKQKSASKAEICFQADFICFQKIYS